ncbi:hypothetical protein LZM42_00510 [Pseudomonas aeruginosa]|nr:hypothetical protein [Pseudomonas aeruginosa]
MTTSKIQMDQIRSTSATVTGENIRAGFQKKSSLSPAEGLQGASPDATCTCPSGDGSLRHPCPAHPAVEQAGGDERAAFEAWATHLPMDRQYLRPDLYMPPTQWAWEAWQARAALAQPSPAPTLRAAIDVANDRFEVPVAKWGTDLAGEEERPEVVAYRTVGRHAKHQHPHFALNYYKQNAEDQAAHWRERGCEVSEDELMTVAQHERITAQLHDALDECDGGRWKLRSERDAALAEVERIKTISDNYYVLCVERQQQLDAALARCAELEGQSGIEFVYDSDELVAVPRGLLGAACHAIDKKRDAPRTIAKLREYARGLPAPVAQAQHSVPEGFRELLEMLVASDLRKIRYAGAWRREVHDRASSILALLAAAPGKEGV